MSYSDIKCEDRKCPNCNRQLEDNGSDYGGIVEDYHASRNSNGMWYTLWCPDCGATARWYDNWKWPIKDEWKIPKYSRKESV